MPDTRAAVLCPGPSLAKFAGRDGYNVVIGVNRAATVAPCDYIVLLDAYTLNLCGELPGAPAIVAARDIYERMCAITPSALHHRFLERDLGWLPKTGVGWHTKGLTTALVLAWIKGADEVTCFGVDWHGEKDWDGFSFPRQQRSLDRWQRERRLVADTVSLLGQRGVKRITGLPDGIGGAR